MTEEETAARKEDILDELGTLVQEWIHITDNEGTTGLLTTCVIAFEAQRFEDDGRRIFRTDHIVLEPSTYSSSIGILQETLWQIHHRGFGHVDFVGESE